MQKTKDSYNLGIIKYKKINPSAINGRESLRNIVKVYFSEAILCFAKVLSTLASQEFSFRLQLGTKVQIFRRRRIKYPSFGFSLMEMVIVLIILSILASIGLPRYNKAVERSRISGAVSILDTIRTAQFHYATEYSVYSGNLSSVGPMIPASDKYFNFSINGSGLPFDAYNDVVGYGKRNGVQAGTYSSDYLIYITENGTMTSSDANVNNFLQ